MHAICVSCWQRAKGNKCRLSFWQRQGQICWSQTADLQPQFERHRLKRPSSFHKVSQPRILVKKFMGERERKKLLQCAKKVWTLARVVFGNRADAQNVGRKQVFRINSFCVSAGCFWVFLWFLSQGRSWRLACEDWTVTKPRDAAQVPAFQVWTLHHPSPEAPVWSASRQERVPRSESASGEAAAAWATCLSVPFVWPTTEVKISSS